MVHWMHWKVVCQDSAAWVPTAIKGLALAWARVEGRHLLGVADEHQILMPTPRGRRLGVVLAGAHQILHSMAGRPRRGTPARAHRPGTVRRVRRIRMQQMVGARPRGVVPEGKPLRIMQAVEAQAEVGGPTRAARRGVRTVGRVHVGSLRQMTLVGQTRVGAKRTLRCVVSFYSLDLFAKRSFTADACISSDTGRKCSNGLAGYYTRSIMGRPYGPILICSYTRCERSDALRRSGRYCSNTFQCMD